MEDLAYEAEGRLMGEAHVQDSMTITITLNGSGN